MQVVKKILLLFIAFTALVSVVMKYSLENERQSINAAAKHCEEDCTHTEKGTSQAIYVASYEAIIPVFHLQLSHDFQFVIFELQLLQETDQVTNYEIPLYFNKFCRTLFRLIISPNAP